MEPLGASRGDRELRGSPLFPKIIDKFGLAMVPVAVLRRGVEGTPFRWHHFLRVVARTGCRLVRGTACNFIMHRHVTHDEQYSRAATQHDSRAAERYNSRAASQQNIRTTEHESSMSAEQQNSTPIQHQSKRTSYQHSIRSICDILHGMCNILYGMASIFCDMCTTLH